MTRPRRTSAPPRHAAGRLSALGCGVLLLSTACTPGPLTVPELGVLEAAPPSVRFGQGSISLDTDIERVGAPDAPSLRIRLTVRSEGAPLPDGSTVDALFLLYDGAIWSTRVQNVPRVQGASELEVLVEGGPRWPPGERIDVVARLAPWDTQAFLIKAEDQLIGGN